MNYCEGISFVERTDEEKCGRPATMKVRGHWYCECCGDIAERWHRMLDTMAAEDEYGQQEEL
jgi:hypothetical protein